MIHSVTGLVHTVAALIALVVGVVIFFRPKATRLHKALGYLYSVSMITLIVTAFSIYRLTKSFNILHIAAIVSAVTLGFGLYHAISRRPKGAWFDKHYEWMSWSYIGLFAAFIAETATRVGMPYLHQNFGIRSFGWFWLLVGIATFAVVYVGAFLLQKNRVILQRYGGR
jgi:uncharacterized membrane protein